MQRHCLLADRPPVFRWCPFGRTDRFSVATRSVVLLAFFSFLTACGGTYVRPGGHGMERQAQAAWAAGDYYRAASLYRQAFESTGNPDAALQAARALLTAGEYADAEGWLKQAQSRLNGELNESQQAQWNLAEAEALAGNGRHAAALALLRFAPEILADPLLREKTYRLKSQLQRSSGQFLAAARTQMEWLNWLQQTGAQEAQQQALADELVATLFALPEEELKAALADDSLDPTARGWLEAAFVGFGMDQHEAERWLSQWPGHPAARYFLGTGQQLPQRVAVLLPLSGRYAGIARSIQHGMIAASYANDNDQELRFFDTGNKGEKLADAYFSALESSPDFIVGPLSRSAVQQLAAMPTPTVPLLALNDLPADTLGGGFYRFPLSAEDEADDAALRMMAEGHRKAVLLVPETAWGRRVATAFANSYRFDSGQVLATAYYDEKANDHSARLRQALGLDKSRARARQLQTLIHQKIESAERVDPRIDAIFLAARPRQARMIRPQLKFLHAGHLPIYATSQVYSGVQNPKQDKDMDGIRFADAPIVIHPQKVQEKTGLDVASLGSRKRYFAFGYDALNVLNRLQWMDTFGTGRLNGLSGNLFLQGDRIHRRLDWARFRKGVPEPLPPVIYAGDGFLSPEKNESTPEANVVPVETR